jgi:hypothetical protein
MIRLIPEIFVQRFDKWLLSFTKFFNIKMNSLFFSEQNLVNLERIEWPLNSVFTNKYGKIRYWPRNDKYLWEFTNSSISVFNR